MQLRRCVILGRKGVTGKTGRVLARALGIAYRSQPSTHRTYDVLIRWGNSASALTKVEIPTGEAIERASDKLRALQIMQERNINVPDFAIVDDAAEHIFPGFLRSRWHWGGRGLIFCEDLDAYNRALQEAPFRPGYVIESISKMKEYRVHIGRVRNTHLVYVQRKLRLVDKDNSHVWNYENGWRYHSRNVNRVPPRIINESRKAIDALGLAFGAVDVVVDYDEVPWVLEVNTAPGLLSEPSQQAYITFLRGILDNA